MRTHIIDLQATVIRNEPPPFGLALRHWQLLSSAVQKEHPVTQIEEPSIIARCEFSARIPTPHLDRTEYGQTNQRAANRRMFKCLRKYPAVLDPQFLRLHEILRGLEKACTGSSKDASDNLTSMNTVGKPGSNYRVSPRARKGTTNVRTQQEQSIVD